MNDPLLILAISIIILGFLLLAGLALWLAIDRNRRNQPATQHQPAWQGRHRAPERQQPISQPPVDQRQPPVIQKALPQPPAASSSATAPAAPEKEALGVESQAGHPPKDPGASGYYPGAELYDQTILPDRPQ
jgi:hypothetical protein